jgi:hypothetical protein
MGADFTMTVGPRGRVCVAAEERCEVVRVLFIYWR